MLSPAHKLDISNPEIRNIEAMSSRENTPRPPAETRELRKRAWARYLSPILEQRDLTNKELGDLLAAVGANYSPATISEWRKGTAGPSETACLYVARALRLPPADVLRAGGFPDAAHLLETEAAGDPRVARIRAARISESARDELEDEMRARLADVNTILDLKLKLLLGAADSADGDEDADAS